ncbi:hypothetical protein EDD28_0134 [Salana multivorans]|uniref:BIG2 domain-containing protein n=1 Tax=Salana multivorans TaxID=120377 RepID=A0A3N2D718_9MICO|nr:hypothetical protein [Salana multivorans]ROR95576.1 hypothetical protein EDD28_0134 [Salana multivorans]
MSETRPHSRVTAVRRHTAGVLSALVLISGATAAGCARSTDGGDQQLPAPVMVSLDDLAGSTVTIATTRPLVIEDTGDEAWSGRTDDDSIAVFSHPQQDGAVFNAGFEGRSEGTTAAEVTSPDGEVTTFTIVVEGAAS